ncbi:MAG: ribose 5-phosphate isomerase B [Syntrophobacteraceae bacterium]|nr:ribose 5-phosphate isomerase B [Syntrophobacteraceae bacterium]
MKIAIGCDHGGFELKETVVAHLKSQGHSVVDLGAEGTESVDYPHYAVEVARAVLEKRADRGILICGSGIGMCMVANRIPGVRAIMASEPYTAKMGRRHNNSNILCLGGRFIGPSLAVEIVDTWLREPFEGGRHQRRLDLMEELAAGFAPQAVGKDAESPRKSRGSSTPAAAKIDSR